MSPMTELKVPPKLLELRDKAEMEAVRYAESIEALAKCEGSARDQEAALSNAEAEYVEARAEAFASPDDRTEAKVVELERHIEHLKKSLAQTKSEIEPRRLAKEKLRLLHANTEAEIATVEHGVLDEWEKGMLREVRDAFRTAYIMAFTMQRVRYSQACFSSYSFFPIVESCALDVDEIARIGVEQGNVIRAPLRKGLHKRIR